MVNFFIGRPIFATVIALLMLLIGGICIFVLPIALYLEIAPPQVRVTTTFTGADAQAVADTVTTPIEQQINGVKRQIYFASDSTSNGVSSINCTFEVGYDQDIAAVDIQNVVQTAQAVLPPEVKQYGVTIKKTSTDIVCVVNLASPDGRYDATFLDNYGQINAVDALRRIPGISDVNPFGRKMLEDREGRGVEALALVTDRFLDAVRQRPELGGAFTTFSARVPQLRYVLDRTKVRRLDVTVEDVFTVLQANLGGTYVNDFNLYGKTWKVLVQAEGQDRRQPEDILRLYVMNRKGDKVPLSALGEVQNVLGPIDVPHYNLYNAARITGLPGPGYSSGQAIAAMQAVAAEVLPEGFGYEWTGVTFQEQKTGGLAAYIFALSVVCVFLFMAALYESWIRPLVIILSVPLATFGAMVGLWLYDMPLDVFGQIGLVMLIGLETKNAILIVEFGVELIEKRGMSIIDSAKEASRQRLRPILMTSFAFVFGVLPMARATGAGAYSRNSLGVVIAFGIAVSTILGRFVIPIYYVLGERFRAAGSRPETPEPAGDHPPAAVRPLDAVHADGPGGDEPVERSLPPA